MSVIWRTPWTGLPVVEFARYFGMSLSHFIGVHRDGYDMSPLETCDDIWYQEAWQGLDKASREDLAAAIFRAEMDMARELGHFIYPRWIEDEEQPWTDYHRPGYYTAYGYGARGRLKTVRAKYGHFIEGGRKVELLVDAAPTIAIDIPQWTGSVTFALPAAGWSDCDFVAAVAGHSDGEKWWLRPTMFTNNGDGTGTLSAWLNAFVDPNLYMILKATDTVLDGLNPAIYLSNGDIEVWRVYNDPSQPALLEWEPGVGCADAACCPTQQAGCITPHNSKQGEVVVQPATWNGSTATFTAATYTEGREPDRVRLWYRSGLPWARRGQEGGFSCEMRDDWRQTTAILAVAYLNKNICACESTYRQISYWQEFPEPDEPISMYPASMPFGPPKRGAIYAWQRVDRARLTHGTMI